MALNDELFTKGSCWSSRYLLLVVFTVIGWSFSIETSKENYADNERFNFDKDLLLAHFDCKTDVDDLHSAAALLTLMSHPDFSRIDYYPVAGTYGTQKGLYVPPNELFQLAFKNNWSDAHIDWQQALDEVKVLAKNKLSAGGDVWIAEAGQSDFSADLIRQLQVEIPTLKTADRIHIVQHSDWNEEVTSAESLQFVKQNADYHKIPDGNTEGNGTPGFRSPGYSEWKKKVNDPDLLKVWQLAVDLGQIYNARDGRYDNEAISEGGLDFSDLSEVCWMMGLSDLRDTDEFFNHYGSQ